MPLLNRKQAAWSRGKFDRDLRIPIRRQALGQFHGERRPLAGHALHTDAAVVLLDDLPADAQAEAGAAAPVFVRLLGGEERLEDES